MYRTLSLFAGIGGFDLGLERTGGFRTVAFCEIDPFCRKVLAKHWPSVPCYEDVRTLTSEILAADGIEVDCIVGGFPCQDISYAGPGAGLAGERSGLWFEFARLIGELRPSLVLVENVSALLGRGLSAVLGTMAALGYDAEWHCIPASALGAPHYRDRFWLVAHPDSLGLRSGGRGCLARAQGADEGEARQRQRLRADAQSSGQDLANAECGEGVVRYEPDVQRRRAREAEQARLGGRDAAEANYPGRREQRWPLPIRAQLAAAQRGGWWSSEPDVGRVAHGVPARVDRLRSLGNAVVPQIPEMIGRAILAADEARQAA